MTRFGDGPEADVGGHPQPRVAVLVGAAVREIPRRLGRVASGGLQLLARQLQAGLEQALLRAEVAADERNVDAGLFLLPTVIMLLVFGPLSGILAKRVGAKVPLVVGSILVSVAYAQLAIAHTALWQIVVSGLITGAGMGLLFAAMSNAIIDVVPATHTGEAISVNSITRTIGGSIGTSVVAAVLIANSTPRGLPLDAAFTQGFWICAGVAAASVIAALALPKRRRSSQ